MWRKVSAIHQNQDKPGAGALVHREAGLIAVALPVCSDSGWVLRPASQPSAAIPAVPRPSAGSGLQIKALHAGTRVALRSFKAWMQGEPVAWG